MADKNPKKKKTKKVKKTVKSEKKLKNILQVQGKEIKYCSEKLVSDDHPPAQIIVSKPQYASTWVKTGASEGQFNKVGLENIGNIKSTKKDSLGYVTAINQKSSIYYDLHDIHNICNLPSRQDIHELPVSKLSSVQYKDEDELNDLGKKKSETYYKSNTNQKSSEISLTEYNRETAGASNITVSPSEKKFDYVQEMTEYSRTNLKLALIFMETCGVIFLSLMVAYGFSETSKLDAFTEPKGHINGKTFHIALATCWIFLVGNALIIFRLLNHNRVLTVKYIHSLILSIGFILGVVSLHAYGVFWKKVKSQHNSYYSVHARLGVCAILLYIILFLMSIIIYSLKRFKQRHRSNFYPYHSFLGFAFFFMALTVACTGIVMEEKFTREGISNNLFAQTWIPRTGGVFGVLFGGGVLFILIYPNFDFDKVDDEI